MKIALIALSAIMLPMSGVAVHAQPNAFVGQWYCQETYTEFDRFGNRTSGFVEEYVIAVQGNGTFQANGAQNGIGGTASFQTEGRWNTQGGAFLADGQGVIQQPMFGTLPHRFVKVLYADPGGNSMRQSMDTPDPTNSYVMARSNVICQRQG